jgi:hypothetical protein
MRSEGMPWWCRGFFVVVVVVVVVVGKKFEAESCL